MGLGTFLLPPLSASTLYKIVQNKTVLSRIKGVPLDHQPPHTGLQFPSSKGEPIFLVSPSPADPRSFKIDQSTSSSTQRLQSRFIQGRAIISSAQRLATLLLQDKRRDATTKRQKTPHYNRTPARHVRRELPQRWTRPSIAPRRSVQRLAVRSDFGKKFGHEVRGRNDGGAPPGLVGLLDPFPWLVRMRPFTTGQIIIRRSRAARATGRCRNFGRQRLTTTVH